MGQYFPRAENIYRTTPLPFYTTVFASRNHCHPLPGLEITSSPENIKCSDYWKAAIKLAKLPQYKKIVFGGSWAELNSVNGEALTMDLVELRSLGKEIILISQPPRSKYFDPVNIAAEMRKWFLLDRSGSSNDRYVEVSSFENTALLESLRSVAIRADAKIINPIDYLCPNRKCPYLINQRPLYIDSFHMSSTYASHAAIFIDSIVEAE